MVIGKKSVMSVGFKTREGVVHPKVSSFCCFLHQRIINNNVRIFSSRSLFRSSEINSMDRSFYRRLMSLSAGKNYVRKKYERTIRVTRKTRRSTRKSNNREKLFFLKFVLQFVVNYVVFLP